MDASPFSSTLSVLANLQSTLKHRISAHDTARAGRRFTDAVVRGAAAGLALRGGLHLVSYLLSLLLRSRRRHAQQRPSVGFLLQDTLRWGTFLGSFAGTFVATDEIVAMLGGRHQTAAWRALVAGAAAGPTLLLTGRNASHTSLAVFILVRGITLLVRCGNLPTAAPWKRRLLAPTRWQHGDVALMCLCSGQMLYAWIVLPSTLPASYIRFLHRHGGKDVYKVHAVGEMSRRAAAGLPPARVNALQGTPYENFQGSVPCEFLHPGQTCAQHSLAFLPEAYLRALPVYLPVYVIPAALVHRRRLLQKGSRGELWSKIWKGSARSSLFLALYCTLAWRGACTGWQLTGHTTGRLIAASCWIAGLATFVEKKSRRMELALYCLSRALESFGLTLLARGILPQSWVPRRLDVIMFSAATAAICHCYADHFGARRNVFKSKYLEVFDFVLGNSGFDAGIITHAPSNAQLVTMASDKLLRSVRSVSNLKALRHNWSSIGSTEVDGAVDVLGMEGREVGGAVDGDDEDARAAGEAQQRRKLD